MQTAHNLLMIVYRQTSLDCTFKHALKAGFSNFCKSTPRQGKPVNKTQFQIRTITHLHVMFDLYVRITTNLTDENCY